MKKIKYFVKKLIPPIFLSFRSEIVWNRVNVSFDECKSKCTGYDSVKLAETCLSSIERVMHDNSVFERDGVILAKRDLNLGLLSSLLYIRNNEADMIVIDFGGSFGSSYFQNRDFVKLDSKNWLIVEQKIYVDVARKSEIQNVFSFYANLEDAITKENVNVVLLSSVLQYVERPIELIKYIRDKKIKYIILDRTSFTLDEPTFLTKQSVKVHEIKSSYPCWFFSMDEVKNILSESYQLIYEWSSIDVANVPSQYKGMLLKIKYEK